MNTTAPRVTFVRAMSWARATIAAALLTTFALGTTRAGADEPGSAEEADESEETEEEAAAHRKAAELAQAALAADKEDRLEECVEKDREALAIEENDVFRLHLATCLARMQRYIDALKNAKDALEASMRDDGDERVKTLASSLIQRILPRIPHVRFQLHGKRLAVELDGTHVRADLLSRRLAVDPGEHSIQARDGDCLGYAEHIVVSEGEDRVIDVALTPLPGFDEHCRVIEYSAPSITYVTLGLDMSAYTDTTNVTVLTPSLRAAAASPVRGWKVGASYLVDVISAASPDVVSTASPAYREARHAVAADGSYKPGSYGAELRSQLSVEPDRVSLLGGGALTADLRDKLVSPRIAYAHRDDRIGVKNTPFSEFERHLAVNDFEVGGAFVLSPTTLLVGAATLETMRGDPSNPYRSVPLFGADVAPTIPAGASVDLVNGARLPLRPREQLPTERDRFALAARINHRFGSGTLRLEERAYVDTWAIKASTTDARYIHSFDRLEVGPHLRLHAQSAASFYQLAYVGGADASGAQTTVPLYRTTARELSPTVGITGGGTTKLRLTSYEARALVWILFSGDVLHSRYFESLYVTSRTAAYATLGIEAEL